MQCLYACKPRVFALHFFLNLWYVCMLMYLELSPGIIDIHIPHGLLYPELDPLPVHAKWAPQPPFSFQWTDYLYSTERIPLNQAGAISLPPGIASSSSRRSGCVDLRLHPVPRWVENGGGFCQRKCQRTGAFRSWAQKSFWERGRWLASGEGVSSGVLGEVIDSGVCRCWCSGGIKCQVLRSFSFRFGKSRIYSSLIRSSICIQSLSALKNF